jgi:hypothetical protein
MLNAARGEFSEDHLWPGERSVDTNTCQAGLDGRPRSESELRAVSPASKLSITSVDLGPEELKEQTPLLIELLRELPGPDRPDYWLGRAVNPIRWIEGSVERQISHVVVAARLPNTRIESCVENLPVGIAFVIDMSQLEDEALDFAKCRYVAIGVADDKSDADRPKSLDNVTSMVSVPAGRLPGIIGRAFSRFWH